jgi:hypothetical protein
MNLAAMLVLGLDPVGVENLDFDLVFHISRIF